MKRMVWWREVKWLIALWLFCLAQWLVLPESGRRMTDALIELWVAMEPAPGWRIIPVRRRRW